MPPAPPPPPPPPVYPEYLRRRDHDQVRLLAVFHFVVGGLAFLGPVFLYWHYMIMQRLMPQFQTMTVKQEVKLPPDFMDWFVWFYVIAGVLSMAAGVLNVLSGMFLRRRRHRVYSMVVAGLNCVQFPFGTVLGVFTLVVLARESVRDLYAANEGGGA